MKKVKRTCVCGWLGGGVCVWGWGGVAAVNLTLIDETAEVHEHRINTQELA